MVAPASSRWVRSVKAPRLRFDEKVAILKTLVNALRGQAPVVAGIASLSTMEAVELARAAQAVGCSGLMVLPPYVYSSDWREMKAHVRPIIQATNLSCMLYNNPVSYKTDFLPDQIKELADTNANLQAVKESSADVRRVTALKAVCGDRLALCVGVDDLIVEGVRAGATGWIAGLVNAFPRESVALYNYAMRGEQKKAEELYKWFLPLAANGHRTQVRPAYQTCATGSRHGARTRPRPALRNGRCGTQSGARHAEAGAEATAEGLIGREKRQNQLPAQHHDSTCDARNCSRSPLRGVGICNGRHRKLRRARNSRNITILPA